MVLNSSLVISIFSLLGWLTDFYIWMTEVCLAMVGVCQVSTSEMCFQTCSLFSHDFVDCGFWVDPRVVRIFKQTDGSGFC